MRVRGVTAGDDFILEGLSVFKTENTRLSILLKKVLGGWSQYRGSGGRKMRTRIFRACDVTSKAIRRRMWACNRNLNMQGQQVNSFSYVIGLVILSWRRHLRTNCFRARFRIFATQEAWPRLNPVVSVQKVEAKESVGIRTEYIFTCAGHKIRKNLLNLHVG